MTALVVTTPGAARAWQVTGSEQSPYFPPPSAWARGLYRLWGAGTLRPALGQTLVTFATSLLVAAALGTTVGILIGVSRRADRALGPTLEFARAMPPSAMVPIAALLIGYNQTMKVAVVTFAALWPIMLNARAGVRLLDPVLLDTLRDDAAQPHRPDPQGHPAGAPAGHPPRGQGGSAGLARHHPARRAPDPGGGLGALIAQSQRNYLSAQVYGLILTAGVLSWKSTEWYQQVLGLDVATTVEGDGFRRTRLRDNGSGVSEVEALKRRFDELGVVHSPVKSSTTGTALITLRDPDNIQIEVFGGPVTSSVAAGVSGA